MTEKYLEVIAENKTSGGYCTENRANNFAIDKEIIVTITLSEYRNLIISDATKNEKINAANSDKYERETENKKLKEENAALKAELYELKKRIDCLSNDESTEGQDKEP